MPWNLALNVLFMSVLIMNINVNYLLSQYSYTDTTKFISTYVCMHKIFFKEQTQVTILRMFHLTWNEIENIRVSNLFHYLNFQDS